jgi:hypothetical protein
VAPDCKCAGQTSPLPGNATNTPQFVLLTHDDSTGALSTSLFRQAIGDAKNPNGCTLPVTYFTMQGGSDCELMKERWQAGDEIAGHSITHQVMDSKFPDTEEEIVGLRQWIIDECGIPAEDVVGWRSPYLVNNPKHRQSLVKGGYSYDSTINEHWPDQRLPNSEPNTVSPNGASRLWPYTMDYGIPQDCAWTGGQCLPDEKYPGLWEIPVWNIQTDNYPDNAFALDPCSTDITNNPMPCDTFALLKDNFDKAYNGNRAPVPMFFHSPWLSEPSTMKAVQKFIQYATSKENTYFITMRQLMDWMKDPVGVDQIGEWLGCGVPGGKAAKGVAATMTASAPAPSPVAEVPAIEVPPVVTPAPGPVAPVAPVELAEPVAMTAVAPTAPVSVEGQKPLLATAAPAVSSASALTITSLVVAEIFIRFYLV